MNKLVITLVAALSILTVHAQDTTKDANADKVFTIVEEMPRYSGGDTLMRFYLSHAVKYPPVAREKGIQGRVFINFIVDTAGNIKDARVLKGIGGGCDEEALRVVNQMPKWIPGRQNGRPVNVQFNLPINFILGGGQAASSQSYTASPVASRDSMYASDNESQKWFYEKNSLKVKDFLYPAVDNVQFDHCHHNEIDLVLYADTTGTLTKVEVLHGTSFPKQDSIIVQKAKEIKGWYVTDSTGKKVNTVYQVNLVFYDIEQTHTHTYTNSQELIRGSYYNVRTWAQGTINKYNKNCENDDFFYKEGVKNFQAGNYTDAIYNFNQAIAANPYDVDAIYNLGVSYMKKDKASKACECFRKMKDLGDNSVDGVIAKNCVEAK